MKERYTVFERNIKNEFEEIGSIIKEGKRCFLVGFDKPHEEFFSVIGYGERGVTPKDPDYLDALAGAFALSSRIRIVKDE